MSFIYTNYKYDTPVPLLDPDLITQHSHRDFRNDVLCNIFDCNPIGTRPVHQCGAAAP